MDTFATLKPIRGVLLKVARKVRRNKATKPPIAERTYSKIFNQRFGNTKTTTKTGILQKNKPHSSACLIWPLAD